jgi:ubiquinone/menaquinone biosynthesis C-methylase UbiE
MRLPDQRAREAEHSASTFDNQAPHYDARVGLPESVAAAVASEIVTCAGLQGDDLVLELGAGTGEIGTHLARLPVRYVGVDNSEPMLQLFRHKLGSWPASLLLADAGQRWPLDDYAAAVVFASRVIHLLDAAHVARETARVCRPGGWLMLGRVLRDDGGVKERLRRHRLELLRQAGVGSLRGREGAGRVIEQCLQAGGLSMGRRVVAEWSEATTPAEVIAGWASLTRMGSVAIDPAMHQEILAQLRVWARQEIGALDQPEASRERYAVDLVRFPE